MRYNPIIKVFVILKHSVNKYNSYLNIVQNNYVKFVKLTTFTQVILNISQRIFIREVKTVNNYTNDKCENSETEHLRKLPTISVGISGCQLE